MPDSSKVLALIVILILQLKKKSWNGQVTFEGHGARNRKQETELRDRSIQFQTLLSVLYIRARKQLMRTGDRRGNEQLPEEKESAFENLSFVLRNCLSCLVSMNKVVFDFFK